MGVTTKKITLTANDYFKLLLSDHFRRRWWLFALVFVMAAVNVSGRYQGGQFFILFAIAYPVLVVFKLWRFAHSAENQRVSTPVQYHFDAVEVHAQLEDGSESRTRYQSFVKAEVNTKRIRLFLKGGSFILLPYDAFYSEEDRRWFLGTVVSTINK